MALATKCPHCNTIFRVAHDQLKLRGGIVRCGSCNEVFDGNAALVEPLAKPSPVMPTVPVAAAPAAEPPHHLDPETVADALAEERLQDETPAAFDAADDATHEEVPSGHEAAAEETPPDAVAPADDELVATLRSDHQDATDDVPREAPSGPERADDDAASDTIESGHEAAAGETPPGEISPGREDDAATESDAAAKVAEATLGSTADAPDSEPAPDADFDTDTVFDSPVADEPTAGQSAPDFPLADGMPRDDDSQPDDELPLSEDPQIAGHELSAGPSSEAPAPRAEEQASPLDFIVDPDEFTDPLASQPAQDTAREHLVAAALDEAHHFNDLPEATPVEDRGEWQAEPPAAEEQAAEAIEAATPSVSEEPDEEQLDAAANRNADEAAGVDLIGAVPESASLAATVSAAAVIEPDDASAADEPGFVKRANRRQRLHRVSKAVMAFGSPILLAALLAQGVTTFRNPLAAAFPALKPTLNTLCEPLGCKVNLPMQIDMLAIEQGELQTLADNTFSFATVLRNQARNPQSWPSIELTLNDANDKPLVRRVFAPRDYLPSQADVDKGFAPRSEQTIKLYFELSQVKASGYHIAIFYP
jgi:predicted Zn finger-like uncharacterized protein